MRLSNQSTIESLIYYSIYARYILEWDEDRQNVIHCCGTNNKSTPKLPWGRHFNIDCQSD